MKFRILWCGDDGLELWIRNLGVLFGDGVGDKVRNNEQSSFGETPAAGNEGLERDPACMHPPRLYKHPPLQKLLSNPQQEILAQRTTYSRIKGFIYVVTRVPGEVQSFRASGFGFQVWGLRVQEWGLGFGTWGAGIRAWV